MNHPGLHRFLIVGVSMVLATGFPLAQATVNPTLSCALEAAMPYVEEGFTVREDNWQGKFELNVQKAIKHQLFKGNEYWFWLGSSSPGVTLSVKVYDSKGRPVDVETKVEKTSASARVLAPKTGLYYIVIKAMPAEPDVEEGKEKSEGKEKKEDGGKEKKKEKEKLREVEWAVVYGFR
jgi:hypothetical protein